MSRTMQAIRRHTRCPNILVLLALLMWFMAPLLSGRDAADRPMSATPPVEDVTVKVIH